MMYMTTLVLFFQLQPKRCKMDLGTNNKINTKTKFKAVNRLTFISCKHTKYKTCAWISCCRMISVYKSTMKWLWRCLQPTEEKKQKDEEGAFLHRSTLLLRRWPCNGKDGRGYLRESQRGLRSLKTLSQTTTLAPQDLLQMARGMIGQWAILLYTLICYLEHLEFSVPKQQLRVSSVNTPSWPSAWWIKNSHHQWDTRIHHGNQWC